VRNRTGSILFLLSAFHAVENKIPLLNPLNAPPSRNPEGEDKRTNNALNTSDAVSVPNGR
jgi:hypothetical protein